MTTPATTPLGILLLAATVGLGACSDDDPAAPTAPRRYAVEVSGETFVVEVASAAQIDALEARLASGVRGVLAGEIEAGDGGYNGQWSWHMTPETVHAPDLAVEVCDGRPSFVEGDLAYWLDTVGSFCPWGAKVVARVE